jgi:hypothetical protein
VRRRLFKTGLVLGLVSAFSFALVPTASAATIEKRGLVRDSGCYGRIVDTWPIINDIGNRTGTLELWYSSRNGGENCAITRSSVGRAEMLVALTLDMDGNRRYSPGDRTSSDYGVYDRYAGGAYRPDADGRCVRVQGIIWKGGMSGGAISGFEHCG